MRKAVYRMDQEKSRELLHRAKVVHVATTNVHGAPIFRTVHGIVMDGYLAFHSAPAGEKTQAIGRRAIVSAEELVAQIPSYFVDPERACPATTYYRSVQVQGQLTAIDEPAEKARVLQALMRKYQPEGGHIPIADDSPLYEKALRGLLVVGIDLEHMTGKAKLGQNRRPEELARILEAMWRRGDAGDPRAIELIRQANPKVATPGFLAAPIGIQLCCAPDASCIHGAVQLLIGQYWNEGIDERYLRASIRGSSAWVVARDEAGAIVATARALSDGGKIGWIMDVSVAASWRGRGVGKALMRLLLDHPRMRAVRKIQLATRDAHAFYAPLGFRGISPSASHSEMLLDRSESEWPSP